MLFIPCLDLGTLMVWRDAQWHMALILPLNPVSPKVVWYEDFVRWSDEW